MGASEEERSKQAFLVYLRMEKITACVDDKENYLERGTLVM